MIKAPAKRFAICLLFSLTTVAYGQLPAEKIDELMTAYTKLFQFNGSVLVAKGGQVFQKGYGWRNVSDSAANDVNTIFQLGSITKQFTAAIILKLAEQKKLSLEDRLSKYFPGYPKGDSILIRHLLTHTSGIYNYTNNQLFMRGSAYKSADRAQMMALFKDQPLSFAPGSKYAYSNSGYLLLGYIITDVTRKPYEQIVREMIFDPLQMRHSGFDFAHLGNDNKATGYNVFNQAMKVRAAIADSSVSYAAGAIYSTIGDLYKWHNALQKYKIINRNSTEAAYTPFKSGYGYGWMTGTLFGRKLVEHGGSIPGFSTFIARMPGDDVVVILLSNASMPALDKISHEILAIIYGGPYDVPKEKQEVFLDESLLKEYVGDYEFAPGVAMKVTLAGKRLKVQLPGQPAFDFFAESDNVFFLKAVDASGTFERGAEGKVERLLWNQMGRIQNAKKIK
jgi:CubicO group peptidase (beta-lactamase class C family)